MIQTQKKTLLPHVLCINISKTMYLFKSSSERGDQLYGERLKQLKLMDLNNRRKYLSICFACSCILNSSSFVFGNWSVNTRHLHKLVFNDHITPKTDSFKYTIAANFPRMWAKLPESVRDNFIMYTSKSSFKKILKIISLKLAMKSWSWSPKCGLLPSVLLDHFNMSAL